MKPITNMTRVCGLCIMLASIIKKQSFPRVGWEGYSSKSKVTLQSYCFRLKFLVVSKNSQDWDEREATK